VSGAADEARREELRRKLNEAGWVTVQGEPRDLLWLIFCGMASGINMPFVEFLATSEHLPGTKVFLRDKEQVWYHCGISEQLTTWDSVARHLRWVVETHRPRHVVTVGASAGGFAALGFAHEIGADLALAFAPQTYCDRETREGEALPEKRWQNHFERLHERVKDPRRREKFNLRHVLPELLGFEARVWVCDRFHPDFKHIRNLDHVRNLRLYPIPCKHHAPAHWLKKQGRLAAVMREAADGLS